MIDEVELHGEEQLSLVGSGVPVKESPHHPR